jgi:hypothetical protein
MLSTFRVLSLSSCSGTAVSQKGEKYHFAFYFSFPYEELTTAKTILKFPGFVLSFPLNSHVSWKFSFSFSNELN